MENVEKGQEQNLSGEDVGKRKEIEKVISEVDSLLRKNRVDMPEGTLVTDPYYADRVVEVSLKK